MKKGWEEATIGEVTARIETVDPTKKPKEAFTYVDVSSVSNETFEIVQTSEVLGADAPSRARRLIRTSDVIFATIRPTLKRIATVPQSLDQQVCSTGYIVLRASARLHPRFLFHHLFSDQFQNAMEELQTGASYPAVTDGQVRQQPIPLPPLEEQQRIVAVLDEAFEGLARARAHAEANLQNAREVFASTIASLYSEAQAPSATLGETCEIYQPKTISAKEMDPNGRYTVFGANGPIGRYSEFNHEEPQLLVTCRGATCGSVNISEPFSWITGNAMVVRPKDERLTRDFLEYFFRGVVDLDGVITGAAQPQITRTSLAPVLVPTPSLGVQVKITDALKSASVFSDQLFAQYTQKLKSLDDLRQSLLQKAFSGELT